MIITICPRCGSMNVTTTCTKCGWSQLTKSTVSTGITNEIELKVSGKALLNDYKRLLFENRNLKEHIAELVAENGRLQESWLWETVCPDGSLRPKVSELLLNLDGWKERSNGWESIVETLNTRIAELESAQRWIPVSERLPEDRATILAAFKNREILTATYYKRYEGFGGVENYWHIEGWHSGEVTHWMPLPQPPEVK